MLISAIRGRTVFPQNARNPQKFLVEKGLPQISRMRTDIGGYGILPCPRSQQHPKTSVSSVDSVGELTQPPICVDQCNPWENYIPQNPRNAQKLLVDKGLPQISRIYTDVGGYGILPYPRSHKCNQTSVSSVDSVGELTQPTICVDQCNPWENCIPTERTHRSFL